MDLPVAHGHRIRRSGFWVPKYRAAEVPDPLFAPAGPALRCSLVTDLLRIGSSLAPRSGSASAAHGVRNFCGAVLNLAREIDAKIKDYISEPGALNQLERMVGQVGREAVVALRRSIFLRRALGYVRPARHVRTA